MKFILSYEYFKDMPLMISLALAWFKTCFTCCVYHGSMSSASLELIAGFERKNVHSRPGGAEMLGACGEDIARTGLLGR